MKLFILPIAVVIGIFFALVFRESLFNFFIPDGCIFHTTNIEEGFWIRNFYYFSSYHPKANLMNNMLTVIIGVGLGLLGIFLIKKKQNS